MRDILEVKNRCMQANPVLDKEGNETGVWKFDSNGANKALDICGKCIHTWYVCDLSWCGPCVADVGVPVLSGIVVVAAVHHRSIARVVNLTAELI